jgi:hypothetical protein
MNKKITLGLLFLVVLTGCQPEDKKQTLSIFPTDTITCIPFLCTTSASAMSIFFTDDCLPEDAVLTIKALISVNIGDVQLCV